MGVMHLCNYPGCMKQFDRKYNLKCHLRIHSNEKPYQCPHKSCSRSFRWKSSLNHHLMSLDHTPATVRRARKARAAKRRQQQVPSDPALRTRQIAYTPAQLQPLPAHELPLVHHRSQLQPADSPLPAATDLPDARIHPHPALPSDLLRKSHFQPLAQQHQHHPQLPFAHEHIPLSLKPLTLPLPLPDHLRLAHDPKHFSKPAADPADAAAKSKEQSMDSVLDDAVAESLTISLHSAKKDHFSDDYIIPVIAKKDDYSDDTSASHVTIPPADQTHDFASPELPRPCPARPQQHVANPFLKSAPLVSVFEDSSQAAFMNNLPSSLDAIFPSPHLDCMGRRSF